MYIYWVFGNYCNCVCVNKIFVFVNVCICIYFISCEIMLIEMLFILKKILFMVNCFNVWVLIIFILLK